MKNKKNKTKRFYYDKENQKLVIGKKSIEKIKKNFYYYPGEMELNKWGYPVWKDSGKVVHSYVAENYVLKRKLRQGEVVHHVDSDKLNFHPDNLVVLNSKEDHKKIEGRIRTETNLDIAYGIIIIFSLSLLGINTGIYNPNINLIICILLIIGLLIPLYPRILRKTLFRLGILKKRK